MNVNSKYTPKEQPSARDKMFRWTEYDGLTAWEVVQDTDKTLWLKRIEPPAEHYSDHKKRVHKNKLDVPEWNGNLWSTNRGTLLQHMEKTYKKKLKEWTEFEERSNKAVSRLHIKD